MKNDPSHLRAERDIEFNGVCLYPVSTDVDLSVNGAGFIVIACYYISIVIMTQKLPVYLVQFLITGHNYVNDARPESCIRHYTIDYLFDYSAVAQSEFFNIVMEAYFHGISI